MKTKIANTLKGLDLHKLKGLRRFFINSMTALSIILLTMLFKRIDFRQTNSLLNIIKVSTEYEFSFKDDGKRIFGRMQSLLEDSMETLSVYNPLRKEKLPLPVDGTLYRDYEKGISNGIDIRVIEDKEPISITNGIVSKVEQRDKKGYFITIQYENMEIVYGYFSQIHFTQGDKISTGEAIGILGTNKDGYKYLRFEIWKDGSSINPLNYIDMK